MLFVVLVIWSRRLLRHNGLQQQIVAQIPLDASLSALVSLTRRQVHVVQIPAVEERWRHVLIFVSFSEESHRLGCDPSRSLKFPFKSMLNRYPSLQIQPLDSNHASSRQVRLQFGTLALFSDLYIHIFWIKLWIFPVVYESALLQLDEAGWIKVAGAEIGIEKRDAGTRFWVVKLSEYGSISGMTLIAPDFTTMRPAHAIAL
ncbi:hypothetical protein K438DRAFT_1768491 [Mycena galopus ATCC 62051]|nr:hypothetical protein K438DRAFT_1768491 [Mycena galopus ATCC 62051]